MKYNQLEGHLESKKFCENVQIYHKTYVFLPMSYPYNKFYENWQSGFCVINPAARQTKKQTARKT